MKIFGRFLGLLFLLVGLMSATSAAAVTLGQTDNFEDGTTQGWVVGILGAPHPAPPVNIPSGGPAGVDDNFLQLTAVGGGGPGSRLSVINLSQWAGNYPAAGVHAIWMDVNNLGSNDLSLRLLLADPTTGPPNNVAFSSDPVIVPAGSGWMQAIFPLSEADLTAGLGSVKAALENATELRIFHSAAAAFPGEAVAALLGVDNITAVPVPASLLLLGSGLLALAVGRKRFI